MQYIYFGALLTAAVVFFLCSLLLFLQRKSGERSRVILAGMSFLSMINYIGLISYMLTDPPQESATIMSVPFLLLGIFVITIYFIYPIEVISPGWITGKRLLKMYLPVTALFLLYCATQWLGVKYVAYKTLAEMIQDIGSFQVLFRLVLAFLIFLPAVLLYYVPYTRKYNNTSPKWMRGYITAVSINMAAYLFVNIYDTYTSCSLYIAISVSCSLYFTYQELYVRLIRNPACISAPNKQLEPIEPQPIVQTETQQEPTLTIPIQNEIHPTKESDLFNRLEQYINHIQGWRDPDLLVGKVISELYTNRTYLQKAMKQHGYDNYHNYINDKRIAEFIQIISRQGGLNYQQALFDVGFRSKTSALRNFKDITGMTPSEYFQKSRNVKNDSSFFT